MPAEKPSRLDERRSGFARYKKDVKERGKPFYPYAMFHDTVMSLVVVGVIVGLAVIWKVTAGEDPNKPGLLGPLYAEPADPGTTNFVPRPDWYFYFLFYLLRIFKWPNTVVLGTVGIPTVLLVLALGIPFLDTRRERRLLHRLVAPGRPRPLGDREGPTGRVLRAVRGEPAQVRQPGDADLRRDVQQAAAGPDRGLPGRVEGPEVAVSGARLPRHHGRIRRSLCRTPARRARRRRRRDRRLCVARRDRGDRDRALPQPAPFVGRDGRALPRARRRRGDALHEQDWSSPYASGSAKIDAYVICPCSMGTLGAVASGAMSNLIHRAASVALKEGRKLVLVPRETPLSTIHLENMLRLRQAGAVVLFAAPGFYHGADSVDDLVDFVVARCLDQLGVENALVPRWGQP